jgi:hypothetical protein
VSGAYDVSPRKGYLCLESEGSEVHFRNLRLFELPPTPADASEQAASMQDPASGGRQEPAPVSTEMEGFRPLYTGVDLDGWLTGPEHRDHWTSRGHILDYDGEGDTLWTAESFEDFELLMDWRWTGEPRGDSVPVVQSDGSTLKDAAGQDILREVLTAGDSGIYLRGNSKNQINLWCWPVGSGELYGYRTDLSMPPEVRAAATPSLAADAPLGQWNRFHITLVGDRITVELNGEIVIDDAWLPDIAPSGPIALQHHGDPIQFCNLFVREL